MLKTGCYRGKGPYRCSCGDTGVVGFTGLWESDPGGWVEIMTRKSCPLCGADLKDAIREAVPEEFKLESISSDEYVFLRNRYSR